ncbi:MAG: VRR-NUC domain-containing protein [Novosphingobium sp.]|nr:VRR-NUC domain-containing protein [Novosphingobium sp.]
MKGLLGRLFGSAPGTNAHMPAPASVTRLEVEPFSHGLVRIRALDFFGPHAASPNGAFHLIWLDRNPDGAVGGHRYEGHGAWSLLSEDGTVLATGRLERPQDGHVSDNGNFILSDWMFGDGLNGRLVGFGSDGRQLFMREFSANLGGSALSGDGRFAICDTANAPGSVDSCRQFLFDLEQGSQIASWPQETGWVERYEFDTANERVDLVLGDGERVSYGFDGAMIDRDGRQRRRIAAGDLEVIRSVLKAVADNPDASMRAELFAGLAVASASGEAWMRARAFRLQGEIHEQAGEIDAAVGAYEKALTIDPQVGVARRLAKLERKHSPSPAKPAGSRFAQQAGRLGIEHEVIELERGAVKEWRFRPDTALSLVEAAALDHYCEQGWSGVAAEGGLVLTLIKAASFDPLPQRLADTFVEALYAQNVPFPEDRFEHSKLLATIMRASRPQIERNWKVISATAGDTPAYYPAVRFEHVIDLFEQLGPSRLRDIAKIFATASYDLRAGWPDLTLWRNGEVRFVEVKAPGDSMHASQARLISNLLVPLGFRVGLAEVRAR